MEAHEFKTMMKEKKLTMRGLGKMMDVKMNSVWRWANGHIRVPPYAALFLKNYDPEKKTVCYKLEI